MASLEKVSEAEACAHLSSFRLVDPDGSQPVASYVAGCSCWRLSLPDGCVVFALSLEPGGWAWVRAAAGRTSAPLAVETFRAIELVARGYGATWLGFQTARRGLVRRARSCGFRLSLSAVCSPGYRMEKRLDPKF